MDMEFYMAKPNELNGKKIVTNIHSNDSTVQKIVIDQSVKTFLTVVTNIYTNQILAVVRELLSNAIDAHAEYKTIFGKNPEQKIIIDVATDEYETPYLIIRDFGIGMDRDRINNIYCKIGTSSKTGTNDEMGMMGIGSKSPFCIASNFDLIVYKDGLKKIYNVFLDASDGMGLKEIYSAKTSLPNGVEYNIPVQKNIVDTLMREVLYMVQFNYQQIDNDLFECFFTCLHSHNLQTKNKKITAMPYISSTNHTTIEHTFALQGNVPYSLNDLPISNCRRITNLLDVQWTHDVAKMNLENFNFSKYTLRGLTKTSSYYTNLPETISLFTPKKISTLTEDEIYAGIFISLDINTFSPVASRESLDIPNTGNDILHKILSDESIFDDQKNSFRNTEVFPEDTIILINLPISSLDNDKLIISKTFDAMGMYHNLVDIHEEESKLLFNRFLNPVLKLTKSEIEEIAQFGIYNPAHIFFDYQNTKRLRMLYQNIPHIFYHNIVPPNTNLYDYRNNIFLSNPKLLREKFHLQNNEYKFGEMTNFITEIDIEFSKDLNVEETKSLISQSKYDQQSTHNYLNMINPTVHSYQFDFSIQQTIEPFLKKHVDVFEYPLINFQSKETELYSLAEHLIRQPESKTFNLILYKITRNSDSYIKLPRLKKLTYQNTLQTKQTNDVNTTYLGNTGNYHQAPVTLNMESINTIRNLYYSLQKRNHGSCLNYIYLISLNDLKKYYDLNEGNYTSSFNEIINSDFIEILVWNFLALQLRNVDTMFEFGYIITNDSIHNIINFLSDNVELINKSKFISVDIDTKIIHNKDDQNFYITPSLAKILEYNTHDMQQMKIKSLDTFSNQIYISFLDFIFGYHNYIKSHSISFPHELIEKNIIKHYQYLDELIQLVFGKITQPLKHADLYNYQTFNKEIEFRINKKFIKNKQGELTNVEILTSKSIHVNFNATYRNFNPATSNLENTLIEMNCKHENIVILFEALMEQCEQGIALYDEILDSVNDEKNLQERSQIIIDVLFHNKPFKNKINGTLNGFKMDYFGHMEKLNEFIKTEKSLNVKPMSTNSLEELKTKIVDGLLPLMDCHADNFIQKNIDQFDMTTISTIKLDVESSDDSINSFLQYHLRSTYIHHSYKHRMQKFDNFSQMTKHIIIE